MLRHPQAIDTNLITSRRHRDDGYFGKGPLEMHQGFQTVHSIHEDVSDDQINLVFQRNPNCLGAGLDEDHGEPVSFQQSNHPASEGFLVLD
jgi:hypothetical protein